MNTQTDKRLVLLHANDNIFVCCQKITANENVVLDGENITVTVDINVGHKLARNDVLASEKIYKYGASIGSAKQDIVKGGHVHLHNLKSDYMPSYQRSGLVGDDVVQNEVIGEK